MASTIQPHNDMLGLDGWFLTGQLSLVPRLSVLSDGSEVIARLHGHAPL